MEATLKRGNSRPKSGWLFNVQKGVSQNPLVPALDAGPQKSKPYQSDVYMTGFNAIPRQVREQDSFDTPPFLEFLLYIAVVRGTFPYE